MQIDYTIMILGFVLEPAGHKTETRPETEATSHPETFGIQPDPKRKAHKSTSKESNATKAGCAYLNIVC